jgi:hypothetical protein
MTETDEPGAGARAYFEAIEETFIRLRGAPLLLSPTDWQVASEWFEAGVPLDLVRQVLDGVFARRRERASKGRVQSLRYCSDAVWQAWQESRELKAGGERLEAAAIDVEARLDSLVGQLPEDLPNREGWVERILALSGSPDRVEKELALLDGQLVRATGEIMGQADREHLAKRVNSILVGLQGRLPEPEIESARDRIWRRAVRESARLPLLSLFSPEALGNPRGSLS